MPSQPDWLYQKLAFKIFLSRYKVYDKTDSRADFYLVKSMAIDYLIISLLKNVSLNILMPEIYWTWVVVIRYSLLPALLA